MNSKRIGELELHFKKFSDVPKEVIVKEDVLRLGLRFTEAALKAGEGCRYKSYRLFTYDKVKHEDLKVKHEDLKVKQILKAPEDIRFKGGPYDLRRIVVSVRLSIQAYMSWKQ
ncbi:hypothetical protein ACFL0M_10785 [Thermodesulfobacteriota bacterium]